VTCRCRPPVPRSAASRIHHQAADARTFADTYHAVKKAAPLLYPGSSCVVLGAGGLGHIGVQCLRALTATSIIVLDANPAALELAGGWGAEETVLVDGSHIETVLDLTDGRGAEVVLDFVGERGAERSYNHLAELKALAQAGKVTLHTQTYPLHAVNDAMDDLDAGRLQGRGILVPSDSA
jgi:NAD+-dependent secondary alcohol dehydrogenase Adh1